MRLNSSYSKEGNDLGGAMTDISFLLIVFFLVTAVFVTEEGMRSQLPDNDTQPQLEPADKIMQFEVINNNEFMLNTITYNKIEDMNPVLTKALERNAQLVAFIAVHRGVSYNTVVNLVSQIKTSGISDFTIASGEKQKYESILVPITIDTQNTKLVEILE